MPRVTKKAVRDNNIRLISQLEVKRTVGLEVEGYMKANPLHTKIRGCNIKRDGSLRNTNWAYGGSSNRNHGCEVVSTIITSLNIQVDAMFEDMVEAGWTGRGTTAGMHIHVDASDFSFKEKVKAAYFAKSVEEIMFLFVKNYRYNNYYAPKMSRDWIRVFDDLSYDSEDWNMIDNVGDLLKFIHARDMSKRRTLSTAKYNWLNIFKVNYPTIEFRIFHTLKDNEEAKMLAYLAHQFIETVKNSTVEQLNFIIESIEEETDVAVKAKKFLVALGIPYDLPIIGKYAARTIQISEEKKAKASELSLSV